MPEAASTPTPQRQHLKRGLTLRHVQFMALGSAIGTGLFYGSSTAIQAAGPLVLVAYIVAGAAVFLVMRALGEMAVRHPVSGSFSEYAGRYLGPFAGFVTGWTYVFEMVVVAIADVTAFSIYMGLWFPNAPRWLWVCAVILIIGGIALRNVKVFGEAEFWLSLIKVSAIVAMIAGGIVLLFVGTSIEGDATPGLHNLWDHGGFTPNGVIGLLAALSVVVFSFGGVETIGITAGEAEDPEHAVPRAVNTVPVRILLFYVLALGVIMMLVPWTSITGDASPFVQIFTSLGLPGAAHVLNAVVITAAISAINADTYGAGRMLFSLAQQGQAPAVLGRTTARGVPWPAVLIMLGALAVGVVLNAVVPESAFAVVASIATFATVWVWLMILLAHLGMRRQLAAAGLPADRFPVPLGVWGQWLAVAFIGLVVVLLGVFEETRMALIVGVVWLLILGVVWLAGGRAKAAAMAAARQEQGA